MSTTQNLHFPAEKIRNIGIIAHIDAGKTTATERMLYYSGLTHKLGSVDQGTTVTDWMAQERERGITIVSAAITAAWHEHQLNIIDTPGHIDFTAEVQRALRVLDGAVVLFDAVHGVESQTETVWRQASRFKVPRICFINKLDRIGADFNQTAEHIQQRLGVKLALLQIPWGQEQDFEGVIDVIHMRALTWDTRLGDHWQEQDIPAELEEPAQQAREQLLEQLADLDDQLMEAWLDGQAISPMQITESLRQATLNNQLYPCLCGSALKNKGIQPLLDAIIDYLPSPLDVGDVEGMDTQDQHKITRHPTAEEPLTALVFKVVSDPFAGRLAYIRVYSGCIKSGAVLYNATQDKKQRVGRIVRIYADRKENIDYVPAGEIDALLSLKDAHTGDTLCDPGSPILLENIQFPEPVISLALEPQSPKDKEKISSALLQLSNEDPTFKINTDPDTGQTLLWGMGELHLDILLDRLQRENELKVKTGNPKVHYKETLAEVALGVEGHFVHQTGGHGQYGHLVIDVAPGAAGSGINIINKIVGGAIPGQFIPAIYKGLLEAAKTGLPGGYEITDLEITLKDGSYHNVDSSDLAFKTAAMQALRKALQTTPRVILEPVCKMEVTIPQEFIGDVLSQLNQRRCAIEATDLLADGTDIIEGEMPLSESFGYATDLRSATKGRGMFSLAFDHYSPMTPAKAA